MFGAQFGAMVALARLMGSDDPEDTAQEAFSRLHSRMERLPTQEAALAYLRKTVVNLSRNRLRHLAVARRHRQHPPAPLPGADAVALAQERQERVLTAVRDLPMSQRAAIVLRFWADLPYAEIAAALGCPESTAKSHARRAMSRLATVLDDVSGGDGL